ncbi:CgeB family protein [Stutzerimonas stutzeri]|uniref:Glycosyltransferase n=1 Tax=Stutzerimonas stutzeri TaxID=316 RepID=A0ABD4XY64_STUST|nr:glycosyltransferase [Stutzerimonas stutzeri]MDH0687613.1 glycosyltransferase [Stutzerimonas stutzeri]
MKRSGKLLAKKVLSILGLYGLYKRKFKPYFVIESNPSSDTVPLLLGRKNKRQVVKLEETPFWDEISVMPCERFRIRAAVRYSTQDSVAAKKAVLQIKLQDRLGNEISWTDGRLVKSERLGGFYRYLPCTNGKKTTIFEGVVPQDGATMKIGFRRFNAKNTEVVLYEAEFIREEGISKTDFRRDVAELSIMGWPVEIDSGKLTILGVMDEFTTQCFAPDINLIQPRPDNWYALAEKYKPDAIFIESAWKGNYGSWQFRVAQYANKPGGEFKELSEYAKQKEIPVIFWNKEDPVHHEKFMDAARLASHIFSTDANTRESYIKKTNNNNVYALPFAAQPQLHKPAALAGRIKRICFAGSWYGNRHAERGVAMAWLLRAAKKYGLDIYDRNYGTGAFPFPDEFSCSVSGSLPYRALCEKYRIYRVFLNVNSVTDSPTMFSRRIFELMACGTPVVSTYAKGIESYFDSDAVWLVKDEKEAEQALDQLLNDDNEWRRRSLLGIREVFTKHTYRHRLAFAFEKAGIGSALVKDQFLLLIARATNTDELNRIINFSETQLYSDFKVIVLAVSGFFDNSSVGNKVLIVPEDSEALNAFYSSSEVDAIGWINPAVAYDRYYLRDISNAMTYQETAKGWGCTNRESAFSYNAPVNLAMSIWKPNCFRELWKTADVNITVRHPSLYGIDTLGFENCPVEV